jgi:hypothetical protein
MSMPIFNVKSGKIRISDPCYDKDDLLGGIIIPAKNGEWVASAEVKNTSWDERVISLTAEFNGPFLRLHREEESISVDSGQAGIFDLNSYKNDSCVKDVERVHNQTICEDEPWYSICCDRTLSKFQWGVIPNGVVSSSGYGDGTYEVSYFVDKDGNAVRIEIDFIEEEDS